MDVHVNKFGTACMDIAHYVQVLANIATRGWHPQYRGADNVE